MKTKTLKIKLVIFITTVCVIGSSTAAVLAVSSNDLESKIDKLNKEISKNQSTLDQISHKRNSLENKLAAIDAEIAQLQAQIAKTNLEIEKTNKEIKAAEVELEHQKQIMFENARTLYKQGDITTVEAFAASDSFSEFINQQEYLERVKEAVNDAAQKVIALKEELEAKKEALNQLALRQKAEENKLGFKREEQQELVNETRGEEAKYQAIVSAKKRSLRQAEKQLAAALAASQTNVSIGGTGGYPYANHSPWTFDSCAPDEWGMCKRHCTSFAAWKVHQDHLAGKVQYDMPYWGGEGNASEWPANARDAGIPTGTKAKKGAIAVNSNVACDGSGFCYGHVMYVEDILANGNIRVSQYNAQATGQYSEAEVAPAGLTFIYFQDW